MNAVAALRPGEPRGRAVRHPNGIERIHASVLLDHRAGADRALPLMVDPQRDGVQRPVMQILRRQMRPLMRAQMLLAAVTPPVVQAEQMIFAAIFKRHTVADARVVAGQREILRRAVERRLRILGEALARLKRSGLIRFERPRAVHGEAAQRPVLILKRAAHIQPHAAHAPLEPRISPRARRVQRKDQRRVRAEALHRAVPARRHGGMNALLVGKHARKRLAAAGQAGRIARRHRRNAQRPAALNRIICHIVFLRQVGKGAPRNALGARPI